MTKLEGRVAYVSGGAAGIGRAVVSLFARSGASVVFTDIDEAGNNLARELGDKVMFIRTDATDEAQVQAAIAQTIARFGKLDIAANIVGGVGARDVYGTSLEELDIQGWNNTLALSLTSCVIGMKYALPPMLAAGSGAIINMSSLAGMRANPLTSYPYMTAKAAIIHLSATAAIQYAPRGIRVNVVAPGITLTPSLEAELDQATRDAMASTYHPIGRLIMPDDVAEACLWLASDRASAVAGQAIRVDGGWAAA